MSILNLAKKLAKEAGKIIEKEAKNLKIQEKAKHDLVTNADKASEKFIIQQIKKHFPDHGILAEESAKSTASLSEHDITWIIDPLDGTTNFAHGFPVYAISIAVFQKEISKQSKNFDYISGEIIAGAIYNPNLDELFYTAKGKGAFLNGRRIHVSNTSSLRNSLAATGFPTTHREINLPYLTKLLPHCQAIRRLGSAALDLAYIACGRLDTFWEFGLKPWDIAAGALLVKEAGGKVTDTNGNLLDLFGQDILATNKILHPTIVNKFKDL
ncbi:MAG: inositol monophosphatase family protein [Candidatus Peregrinibacteria bacterium]